MQKRVLVTGAGGFIGHHLVRHLKDLGYWVRGVDLKYPEFQQSFADEFLIKDLRELTDCTAASTDVQWVFNLAADMGGIGYLTAEHALVARNNVLINSHMLEASRLNKVERFLFSSSACVYARYKQESAEVTPLKEEDAYPADPEPGYGWEKLFTEELCRYYREDYGFETRIVRFHNVYGPYGTFEGGREKAPAAMCRKVALAPTNSKLEIWGDGEQTRSFMYIDDCVAGLLRIMNSDYTEPINLGSDHMLSINQLAKLVCEIAGKQLEKNHDLSQPQGVRGRNSDNSRTREVLGWEPQTPLTVGLIQTYSWIEAELRAAGRLPEAEKAKIEAIAG